MPKLEFQFYTQLELPTTAGKDAVGVARAVKDEKEIQLLLYLTKKLMHCKSTTLRLLLILRWIKLLLKSLVRPENDGNVLANVIEASFDNVDLHEVIGDQDSEARGTCGWRVHCCFHRLQINLTLGQGLLAVIF